MNIYSIYRIINLANRKSYIGWTTRDPQVRFKEHLNGNPNEMVIAAAVTKYGKDSFCLEIVYQTLDYDHSREMEGFFIAQCNSLTESEGGWGYNIDLGGKGHKRSQTTIEKHRQKLLGRKQSEEHKRKRGLVVTGTNNGMYGRTGEDHPNWGKNCTNETKQKISISQKKRFEKEKTQGTYKHHTLTIEEREKMKETKRKQKEEGKTLKYKNVVIRDPNGDTIHLPPNYADYFKSIPLNNFMSKCIENPEISVKGYYLISYELNK